MFLRLSIILILFMLSSASAGNIVYAAAGDSTDFILCDYLKDPSIYKKRQTLKFIIAGKEGWLFRSHADFRTEFGIDDETRGYMKRFASVLKQNGTDLVFVVTPTRGIAARRFINKNRNIAAEYDPQKATEGYRNFIRDMQKSGFYIPDLGDIFYEPNFFSKRDHHWSEYGADMVAKNLAAYIRKNVPSYQNISKKKFITEIGEEIEYSGSIAKYAMNICGIHIPSEKHHVRVTVNMMDKLTESDLFGYISEPEIVLVGTSNSTNFTNFSGALMEHLGANVNNKAIAGGSLTGSIMSYLFSDEYRANPPKIMIWEIPGNYGLNRPELYKQLIPALYGRCTEKTALLSRSGNIKPGEVSLFRNIDHDDRLFAGQKYYVYLNIGPIGKTKVRLKANILHADGSLNTIEMRRTNRVENNGHYFFEFKQDIESPVMHVVIETDKQNGYFDARICMKSDQL